MLRFCRTLALGLALISAPLGLAAAIETKAEPRTNSTQLWFEGGNTFTNATLNVSGPNGYYETFSADRGTPTFRASASKLADGMYFYELTAATAEQIPVDTKLDNGRGDNAKTTMAKGFTMTGSFEILRGVIIAAPVLAEGTEGDGDTE